MVLRVHHDWCASHTAFVIYEHGINERRQPSNDNFMYTNDHSIIKANVQ